MAMPCLWRRTPREPALHGVTLLRLRPVTVDLARCGCGCGFSAIPSLTLLPMPAGLPGQRTFGRGAGPGPDRRAPGPGMASGPAPTGCECIHITVFGGLPAAERRRTSGSRDAVLFGPPRCSVGGQRHFPHELSAHGGPLSGLRCVSGQTLRSAVRPRPTPGFPVASAGRLDGGRWRCVP